MDQKKGLNMGRLPNLIKERFFDHKPNRRGLYRVILVGVMLASILLSACASSATPTAFAFTPSGTRRVTRTPASTVTSTSTPVPTATNTLVPPTITVTPVPSLTPTPTTSAETVVAQTVSSRYYNLAADIQNNVNGVEQVLNVSAENGTVTILLTTTYTEKVKQYNSSFNVVQYLSTYFTPLSQQAIANLFGGKQFTIHLKTYSLDDEYIMESTTPYELMAQVGQTQVNQNQWAAQANVTMGMDYKVIALCSVGPETVPANTNTTITISTELLLGNQSTAASQPAGRGIFGRAASGAATVKIRQVDASWKDSTGHQYYCSGNPGDSSCQGHGGTVTPNDTITIDVNITAVDGLQYTCQTTYTTTP
jgi:hypothetical protein